jgi:predicted amidohydrolase YtcJ
MTDDELRHVIREAKAKGFQVGTHAIGDRAVRRVLDAYAAVGITATDRYRVEHASLVSPADLPRFARLGVIASLQPNFVGEYSRWGEDRVGAQRARWIKPTRDLLASGASVAAGSDYPAADTGDPVITLFSLLTRKAADGTPANGWFPEQRVSTDAALQAMTAAPAFAAFQEDRLGAIAPGRYADFTALSADPREIPRDRLRDLTVQMTVVGGAIVYNAARNPR